MITVLLILAIAAFVMTVGTAMGKVPLWIAVLLLSLLELLRALPLGK